MNGSLCARIGKVSCKCGIKCVMDGTKSDTRSAMARMRRRGKVFNAAPFQETGTSASVAIGLLPPSLQPSERHQ